MGSKPPAPFLTKTHQMVENGETDDVISWGEKGISFVVWKPVEFASDLLPAHFKHNNFSSFVRQLNTYGFRKVVSDRWEFANDNFRRGEQRLLCDIRRKKVSSPALPLAAASSTIHLPPSSASRSADVHGSSSTSSPPPRPPQPQHLLNLSSENEKLRRDNQALSTELEHAKRHYEKLLGFLSKYVDVRLLDLDLLTRGIGAEEAEEVTAAEEEDEDEGEKVDCLKLFGVLLKESRGTQARRTKRRRCDGGGALSGVGGSWMNVFSTVGGRSNARE